MRKRNCKYTLTIFALFIILLTSSFSQPAIADDTLKIPGLFREATQHFTVGEYNQSIILLDEILDISPNNTKALLMKGIALSNLDRHKNSILEFKKVLEIQPNNLMALLGIGVGFGNFGEYKQANKYFMKANDIAPENHIVTNYKEFAEKVIVKYPYNAVEEPKVHQIKKLENIPDWIKNNAGWWSEGKITEKEFLSGIYFMIENGIIVITLPENNQISKEEQLVLDRNQWEFERYLDKIIKTVSEDGRYIEYPNPSGDVIKKFMRDYIKWNFDQQIEMGNARFPSASVETINDTYFVTYNVYINKQPNGLPLDHVGTLTESFQYWEEETLTASDGKTVKITFTTTETKADANLWVTWVVRSLGQNVLGHANLGKGVVEVALVGYGCDGNFQLYHVETVKQIMTHELGHGIGLLHSENRDSIMYPALNKVDYAYCILDVNKQFTKDVSGIVLRNE